MDFRNLTRNISNSSVSNTCSSLQPVMKRETNLRTLMPILLTIVAVANNLLVMFLVFCTKQLRKNINFYIVNMAVSDMITSLGLCMRYIFSYLYEAHGILVINDIICKLFTYFKFVALTVSLVTLLVISIDRYRAVSSPLNVANVPHPCFVSLVVLTWIIPGAIFVYVPLNAQHTPGRDLCRIVRVSAGLTIIEIIASSFFVVLYLCLIVINIQILRRLKKSSASLSGLSDAEKKKRNKKFRSAVRMVLCSLVLYILCTSPGLIFTVMLIWLVFSCSTYVSVVSSVDSLFVVNSALGPIIYLIFLQDFRDAFKNRFCHWICCVLRVTPAADEHNKRVRVFQDNPVFEPNDGK